MNIIKNLFTKKLKTKQYNDFYEKKLVPLTAIRAYEKSKEFKDEIERKKIEEDLRKKEKMYNDYRNYLEVIKKVMWKNIDDYIKCGIFSFKFNIKKFGNEEEDRIIRKFIKENLIDDLNRLGYRCKLDTINHNKRNSSRIYTSYTEKDLLGNEYIQVYTIEILWNKTNEKKNDFIDLDLKRKATNQTVECVYGDRMASYNYVFDNVEDYEIRSRICENNRPDILTAYCRLFEDYYNTKGVLYVLQ